jgi:simple sugar transport system permease protein
MMIEGKLDNIETDTSGTRRNHALPHSIVRFVSKNRRALSALLVFVIVMLIFIMLNPRVFLNPIIYRSIFRTLPMGLAMTVPLVFVIVSGEIDLSFGAVIGLGAWTFAASVQAGWNPFLGAFMSLLVGACAGLLNGLIVTRIGLSSLVSTLATGFFFRGLIFVGTEGNGIPLAHLRGTPIYKTFAGSLWGIPSNMIWAILLALIGLFLFNSHIFGARICCIGDNQQSALEMGINVTVIKSLAFVYVGITAGAVGVLFAMLNQAFYPGSGDGLVMIVLASVFVGGTPTWGGVGTVAGAIFGACTVGVIQSGILAAGVSHLWTQFFYGLVIILSLLGHKFSEPRY